MITSIEGYLRYFDAVHRRAIRDIGALPPQADGWAPSAGEGENAWSINQLVGHMASARLYFASAYRGEGWISPPPPHAKRDEWLPTLEASAAALRETLEGTPDEWLERKVQMMDTDRGLSGWRVLMMLLEHEIHHRSQIETYAGINGWPVMDIYNRSAETIGSLQESQRSKYRPTAG